ncbi:MAG TPA: spermidine synthase [Thermoanaerobaculia bacterium]|nr:spermidine synthase [Thermoanaerobaculia bacterium]
MRPWETLDAVDTEEGRLELRRRGPFGEEAEFVITVAGRVLMSSMAHLTEVAVAEIACGEIAGRERPRVLIGGLGMGFTLRAALDSLPKSGRVVVAEINEAVLRWCRGPLAPLTRRAAYDPRAKVVLEDVAEVIAEAARDAEKRFDAIILDLYEGPRNATQAREDPFYGPAALKRTREALTRGGVLAVWSEDPDAAFEKRLRSGGFNVERRKPGKGGPRHSVYIARPARSR